MKIARSRAFSRMSWTCPAPLTLPQHVSDRSRGGRGLPHLVLRRVPPARLDLVGVGVGVDEPLAVRRERRAAREARLGVAVAVQVVLPALDRAAARAVDELEAE